jgi:stage II sporulation protein GA (sporulation sigma-E factor processing peptidase)
MTVYLDVIWFLNVCFDAFLLMLTSVLLKKDILKWRLILAAVVGSTIVLFMFTPYRHFFSLPAVKILYSIIMILIAFGYKRFFSFLQNIFTFYLVTFAVGGGLFGIHYMFNFKWLAFDSSLHMGDPVSWIIVIIGFPLLYIFTNKQFEGIESRNVHYEHLVDVSFQLDNNVVEVKGLVDSGNQLHDPITRSPVMIIDISFCKQALPKSLLDYINHPELIGEINQSKLTNWEDRLKIIPYRAVGSGQQFLFAIKPEHLKIIHQDETIFVKKGLVAFSTTTLSSEKEYGCIVHPKMIVSGSIIKPA